MKGNQKIVMKVAVMDTLRAIEPGESVTFDCREFTSFASVVGQLSKLNASGENYTIKTTDNGATFTVTRHKLLEN